MAAGGVVTTYDKATFNQILQPDILTEDYKLMQLRQLMEAFENFYNSSGIQNGLRLCRNRSCSTSWIVSFKAR